MALVPTVYSPVGRPPRPSLKAPASRHGDDRRGGERVASVAAPVS